MSISTLTAVAVARNERTPTKSDVGEVTRDSEHQAEPASLPQLLVKQIPTGLVAAYTALTAATVELIAEPTPEQPSPDQLLEFRWAGFVLLVVASMALTYFSYRSKAEAGARIPVAEVLGVGIASAGWGLVIPESPLLAQMTGNRGTASVLLIAFAAVVLNLVIAARLRSKA